MDQSLRQSIFFPVNDRFSAVDDYEHVLLFFIIWQLQIYNEQSQGLY